MNVVIEKKLSELREEAHREGLHAVHMALHMLHACYLEQMDKDFAKHCCEFSTLRISPVSSINRES